ncbi:MAG: YdbH domain-containing protein [Gammaproteobacteria bacterium]|nr:YdbH domain-containing protein [Gammaproteobacteria bacterium]
MKKIFFIIFVGIIFLCLFLMRALIIQEISPKVAKYYGIDISSFEVSQFDIDKIVIPKLIMRHVDDSIEANIEIHNLVVDINKYNAEVTAASSSYIDIDVMSLSNAGASSSEKSIIDIVKLLPIFGINIEHLKLHYHAYQSESIHFDGSLIYAKQVTLEGVLSYENGIDAELNLSVNESDFSLDILHPDATVVAFDGDYDVQDDWLSIRLQGDVSFSEINKFLILFNVEQYVQDDVSTISANIELDLTRSTHKSMQSFAADVDIDSELHVSSKQHGVKQAHIDVRANCHVEQLNFASCAFKDPQRAEVEFYQTPIWVNEYFDRIGRRYVVDINPSDQVLVQLSLKEVFAINAKGDAAINFAAQSSLLKVDIWLSDLIFDSFYQEWKLAADYQLKLEGQDVSAPTKISRLLVNGRGNINADNEQVNVYMSKEFIANALNVYYEGYKIKKVQLKSIQDTQFIYRYQDGIKSNDMRFGLSSGQLRSGNIELELAPIELHIRSADYSSSYQKISANVQVDNILIRERAIPVTAYKLNANIDLNNNKLSVDGGVNLGEQKHPLDFSASQDLFTGLGSMTMNADAVALANNEIIEDQIGETGFPLQLKGGMLDLGIDAIWNINNSVSEIAVKLIAHHVMGDYAQNQFSNLNATLEFLSQEGWKLKQPAEIEIGLVNVGVPLRDVSMRLERMEYQVQEQPSVKLSNLYASALDGSIYADQVEVDLNRRENGFSIFLSSLSLEKLIALNQTEDLVASGTLDGELPMRLDDGVLLIDSGWLRADESGGYIKYGRIGEVLMGNENLRLVGELLEDFQYNEMSAQVDLVSGGDLTLSTKLYGRSPNAALNKQVNLNFNIDFNLWKFLESARLLTHIDQGISEQILSNQKP